MTNLNFRWKTIFKFPFDSNKNVRIQKTYFRIDCPLVILQLNEWGLFGAFGWRTADNEQTKNESATTAA